MNRPEHRVPRARPVSRSRPRSHTGDTVAPARPGTRRRATSARTSPSRPPVPATIWALGAEPGDLNAVWPLPLVDRVVTSFAHPGDLVVLIDPPGDTGVDTTMQNGTLTATNPALAAALDAVGRAGCAAAAASPYGPAGSESRSVSRPYWAEVFHDPDADTGAGYPASTGSHEYHDDDSSRPCAADLVIASIRPDAPPDDRLGIACAGLLRTGGILVVLTHSEWTDGRLHDPTGPVVATAQNADLLYLQHIVAIHALARDGQLSASISEQEDEERARHRADVRGLPAPHRRIHTDVLVFANPRDHEPPSPAAGAFESGVIQ